MLRLNDSVQTAFDSMSTADARYPAFQLYVSWLRNAGAGVFGVVGTSLLNNCLLRGENTVVTPVDTFEFFDETDRVMRLEYERRLEEPLGGMSFGMIDVVLDNSDKRFTPEYNSTIGTSLLPNRPLKMALGFDIPVAGRKMLELFKGLSGMIKEDKMSRTVSFGGYDYLSYLNELEMESALLSNKRSDEAIELILGDAGFSSTQYELDEGLNTIGFMWFKKGETAGQRIKKICEAEEGHFFQDENGILRFHNRRKYNSSPYSQTQKVIHSSDIIEWRNIDDVGVLNSVVVSARPRKVLDYYVEVWRDGVVEEVEAGDTITVIAKTSEPIYSNYTPVADTDYIANSASDGSGTFLTDKLVVSRVTYADSFEISIKNTGSQKAYITYLRLRGKPAIITSEIQQKFEDDTSIGRYGKNILNIENDFIDSNSYAYYLARTIVNKYKDPLKRVQILVRGMPQLQLKDKVSVYDRDLSEYKTYRVMVVQGIYQHGEFLQYLTLREVSLGEADSWAVVGTSVINSENEVLGF